LTNFRYKDLSKLVENAGVSKSYYFIFIAFSKSKKSVLPIKRLILLYLCAEMSIRYIKQK